MWSCSFDIVFFSHDRDILRMDQKIRVAIGSTHFLNMETSVDICNQHFFMKMKLFMNSIIAKHILEIS